jgi:hypothetical protein
VSLACGHRTAASSRSARRVDGDLEDRQAFVVGQHPKQADARGTQRNIGDRPAEIAADLHIDIHLAEPPDRPEGLP